MFRPTDPMLAAAGTLGGYSHWGLLQLEDGSEETVPGRPGYRCAVANSSMAYGAQLGQLSGAQAWGWADQECGASHVTLCRMSRGHLLLAPACWRLNTAMQQCA